MLCDYFRFLGYVIVSHHANLSKMCKHWGSFLTHCINVSTQTIIHKCCSNSLWEDYMIVVVHTSILGLVPFLSKWQVHFPNGLHSALFGYI